LQRLEDTGRGYHAKVTPEAEKAHFLSRFWAADDYKLPGHLNMAANENFDGAHFCSVYRPLR
jgi:hypothetical protein